MTTEMAGALPDPVSATEPAGVPFGMIPAA